MNDTINTGCSQTIKIAVAWDDIDAMGHANNLSFMRWAQSARVALCHSNGSMKEYYAPKTAPIVAAVSAQFIRPVYFPDELTVRSHVTSIGHTSFQLLHEIYNGKDELTATVSDVLVYFDYSAGKKLPLPDELRKILG